MCDGQRDQLNRLLFMRRRIDSIRYSDDGMIGYHRDIHYQHIFAFTNFPIV